jgi:soluble lytic murein transglycosylase
MVRGSELWRLNQLEDARREFESYRLDVQNDPVKTFRLANYLIEIGLYRSGIIASRQVLDLAGLDDAATLTAPAWFNHQRFGLYYGDLVQANADEYGFDPLFITSVMRQESLFEGFVTSTAGARGLMQIIPSTGEEISRFLNWPANYTEDDLYRPAVSITFGASYLNRQRAYFNGDIYATLAAYNGGAGNASKWLALADGDMDLFVEVIRFSETRDYIRRIYELYQIYTGIYGSE